MSEKYAVMPMEDYKDACDSLRKKLGTEDKIKSGDLKPLIDSIKAPVPEDQKYMTVNFYDYDGTLLYEYPLEEAHALTELPPLPSHEGLVCQGWNYTLEDIQEWDIPLDVGATYITEDGSTRIVIEIENEEDLAVTIGMSGRNILIDWGDSSSTQLASNLGGATHTYQSVGEYCIVLSPIAEDSFIQYTAQSFGIYKIAEMVKHIYTGNKFNFYGGGSSAAKYRLKNIETVTISNDVENISDQLFCNSYRLKAVVIPRSVTRIDEYEPFERCGFKVISFPNKSFTLYRYGLYVSNLERLCLPKVTFQQNSNGAGLYHLKFLARGNTNFGANSAHNDCSALEKVVFSSKATSISANSTHFQNCYSLRYANFPPITYASDGAFVNCRLLESLKFAKNISSISYDLVSGCSSLKILDFSETEAVPSLTVSTFMSGVNPLCEILVKGELYPIWKRATNWTKVASKIKPIGEYVFLEKGASKILEFNEKVTISLIYENSAGDIAKNVNISASNSNLVGISNENVTDDMISFDVTSFGSSGDTVITVSAELGGKTVTSQTEISVVDIASIGYRVEAVEGATYGFEFNEDGWWESTNQGIDNSYAICKIIFNVEEGQSVYLDCISYGDQYYCFGIVSKLDTTLSLSYNTDGSANVQKSFYHSLSPNVQTVSYYPTAGEHFIYAKYKKQNGVLATNDSLQFRLRIE